MKKKMSRTFLVLFLIASVLVLTFSFVYGLVELLFPLMFLFGFFMVFLGLVIRSSIQADANPGLERLEEPDYWHSAIYEAWLYVTDREKWASFACLWSCVFGVLFGSVVGWLVMFYWKTDVYTSLVSWFSGMFMMLPMAGFIATNDYWSKAEERRNDQSEE